MIYPSRKTSLTRQKTMEIKKSLKELSFRYALEIKGLQFFVVSNSLSSYSFQLKTSRRTLWKNETVKGNGLLDHK